MEHIAIAHDGRPTTRLGFGCSSIMGALGRRQSLQMLEAAYDAGLRHFDVAPMYGYGEAESCLGEFLALHLGQTTVTTKYGIAAPRRGGLLRTARRVAGPLLQRVPALKKRLARTAVAVAAPPARSRFSAEEAKASLENSLRQLRTGYIDLLLLHEVEAGDLAGDLADDGLLRFLEDAVSRGQIGSFGVGSDSAKLPALLSQRPAFCSVVQHDWSVLDPLDPPGSAFHVHHRALTDRLQTLHASLSRDAARCRRWSDIVGVDLSQRAALAAVMLKAALVLYPDSILLVSSKNPAHIRENVRVAGDAGLEGPARRLYDLVQREGLASTAPPLPEDRR